jgi:hypothetical protein
MLFKEINPVYTDNHTRPVNVSVDLLTAKVYGTYSYHWILKGGKLHG